MKQLKVKVQERRTLLDEKKAAPAIQIFRQRELTQKITALTEDIEKLKSEKALLLNQFNCAEDQGMAEVKQHITSMENSLNKLDQQETKYASQLEAALAQYTELQQETVAMDSTDLDTARQAIRPAKECETIQRLQTTYGKKFDSRTLAQSQMDVAEMLDETAESVSIRQELQQLQGQQNRQSHVKERSQER